MLPRGPQSPGGEAASPSRAARGRVLKAQHTDDSLLLMPLQSLALKRLFWSKTVFFSLIGALSAT